MERASAARPQRSQLTPIQTLDATGASCLWTVYRREIEDGGRTGELVEHECTGDRFEVDARAGWLQNGKPVPMLAVLEALPLELADWALRQALSVVSEEELTPLGVDVARVILLAGTVLDLVGDPRKIKRGRFRRSRATGRRAAA